MTDVKVKETTAPATNVANAPNPSTTDDAFVADKGSSNLVGTNAQNAMPDVDKMEKMDFSQVEMPPAKMEIRDLDFFYGDFKALKGCNLDIPDNKVTAFIGPSGCGKSTLLRTFNRMFDLYPGMRAEGTINLDGKNILGKEVDVNLLRARVGMVFQKPTPFPMSIYDNVAFGVKLYEKLSKSEMDDQRWALKKSALWPEAKDKLKASGLSLSGGQQQRLWPHAQWLPKPEVLLLDEPTSALDPISTGQSKI